MSVPVLLPLPSGGCRDFVGAPSPHTTCDDKLRWLIVPVLCNVRITWEIHFVRKAGATFGGCGGKVGKGGAHWRCQFACLAAQSETPSGEVKVCSKRMLEASSP